MKLNNIITYDVKVENGIKYPLNKFKKKIQKTLQDSRSWCAGYFIFNKNNPDFTIILSKPRTIETHCNLYGLSCADSGTNTIYINSQNWIHGAKPSKLDLDDYQTYVINHEVGHILGIHEHLKPRKGCKVPVMNQSTNGIGKGLPNMWPIKREQDMVRVLYES